MVIALLLSCAGSPADTGPAEDTAPASAGPSLEGLDLLTRLSLDLRGRIPTAEELAAVEADPVLAEGLPREFMEDPGFRERLVTWYADVWHTRTDRFLVGADGDAEISEPHTRARFIRDVGEEPLQIIARIGAEDLPWTEVVTGDWSMATPLLRDRFPVEVVDPTDEEVEDWVPVRYTDARPAAGMLASNGLYWRYTSAAENFNRGRSRAILQGLMCDERFDQPIDFESTTDAVDRDGLQSRAQTDPGCVVCHVALDPMGSFFWGFYRHHPESYSEALRYYPDREGMWQQAAGVAPAFYGQAGESLYDLGWMMAADPRIVSCAVEQGFSFLLGRPPEVSETDRLNAHREAFLAGELTLRDLYESLVADPAYRSLDGADPLSSPVKRMDPEQFANSVEAVTGWRWTEGQVDMVVNDSLGVRVLMGGADGAMVTEPATDHSASAVLAQERIAEAAAAYAVDAVLMGEDVVLLDGIEVNSDAPGDLADDLATLTFRLHGRRLAPDDPEIAGLATVWEQVAERRGPQEAWTLCLSALLRHPDFLHY